MFRCVLYVVVDIFDAKSGKYKSSNTWKQAFNNYTVV